MRTPCIVGLDPGTTLGCAILGIDGSVLHVFSGKETSLSQIIERVLSYGTPIIVGCDKKHAPHFVEEFSRKTGAKLVSPEQDILVKDKHIITKQHKPNNAHERDALASAILARKSYSPFYRKVVRFAKNHQVAHLKNELFTISLKKGISLRHVLRGLQDKPKLKPQKLKRSHSSQGHLQDAYHVLREDYSLLQKEHALLQERFRRVEDRHMKLSLKAASIVEDKKAADLLQRKEHNLHHLTAQLEKAQRRIDLLSERVYTLRSYLLQKDEYISMAILPSLSEEIPDVSFIYVEDPNTYSVAEIESLKKKEVLLILGKKPSPSLCDLLPPFLLDINLPITHVGDIGIINKKEFEQARKEQGMLFSLIDEYKESRRA